MLETFSPRDRPPQRTPLAPMPRTTIAEVDSKRLVTVFGPRDQHLRRIRAALGVGVSARDDSIHIEGDEAAVAQAPLTPTT